MNPQEKRPEIADPKPKAPYERPELKRLGTLRDVTAVAFSIRGTDATEE
ncbi:MAG: hypothetical protein HYY12_03850 [Candidatus Methylomirabilis oxyfera]|nr:hypothetical protein [Candidatus Methylomirabilis oxyfera]